VNFGQGTQFFKNCVPTLALLTVSLTSKGTYFGYTEVHSFFF